MILEAISCTDGLIQSTTWLRKIIFLTFVTFGPYPELLVNSFQHLGYSSVPDQFLHRYLQLNHVNSGRYRQPVGWVCECHSRSQGLKFSCLQIGIWCPLICLSVLPRPPADGLREFTSPEGTFVTTSSPVLRYFRASKVFA